MEVAQGIQLPAQLGEEMLELVLEPLLWVVLCHAHRFLHELQAQHNNRWWGESLGCGMLKCSLVIFVGLMTETEVCHVGVKY